MIKLYGEKVRPQAGAAQALQVYLIAFPYFVILLTCSPALVYCKGNY